MNDAAIPQNRAIRIMADYMDDMTIPDIKESMNIVELADKPEDRGSVRRAYQLSEWLMKYGKDFFQKINIASKTQEGTPEFLKAIDGCRTDFYRIRQTTKGIAEELTKISDANGLPPLDVT